MAQPSAASETRTLHPLAFPARLSDPGAAELRRGLYVDCETTGFSPEHDAVIELALLPFTYTLAGTVVEVLHNEAQSHRNDPGRALPAEITHLTGLTDDDVRGERIDVEAASALIERSGLIVAHNARFDRPFVERVLPAARARPWACTRAEVPWVSEGLASQALHCSLCACGVYARDRHRALADCEAGVWLLAQRLPVSGDSVLAAMRRRALTPTVRLWAIRAPFESKELLRARLPFSARPQPAPGAHPFSRAFVGSDRGMDLIHRDRLESGHVDAAFVEDRLHPLRGSSNAAPGRIGVLRVAVLRGPFAAGAARSAGPELGEDIGHLVAVRRHAAFELGP